MFSLERKEFLELLQVCFAELAIALCKWCSFGVVNCSRLKGIDSDPDLVYSLMYAWYVFILLEIENGRHCTIVRMNEVL